MERFIVKMVIRRTISLILTGFLILFIYSGSYHSFCECYARSCLIHAHVNPPINLWVLQTASVADIDLPQVASYFYSFEDSFALSTGFLTPIKTRAPPYKTFAQIIHRIMVPGLMAVCDG